MLFRPPMCPVSACPSRTGPQKFVYWRRGHYRRRCDARRVPVFQCRVCRKYFSSQSFRVDYGMRKPWINVLTAQLLCGKMTLRKTAEVLGVKRRAIELRLDRFSDQARAFHEWVMGGQNGASRRPRIPTAVMDELESYETDHRLQPLTVGVIVDKRTHFIIRAAVGALPARSKLKPHDQKRKEAREVLYGKRRSESRAVSKETIAAWTEGCDLGRGGTLITDKKSSYRRIAQELRELRPGRVLHHARVPGKQTRNKKNPLFPINHTNGLLRDSLSRLVRRNWGGTKERWRLTKHLWLFIAFRNYVRGITRKAWKRSASSVLRLFRGKLTWGELLRWRAPFFGSLCAN